MEFLCVTARCPVKPSHRHRRRPPTEKRFVGLVGFNGQVRRRRRAISASNPLPRSTRLAGSGVGATGATSYSTLETIHLPAVFGTRKTRAVPPPRIESVTNAPEASIG